MTTSQLSLPIEGNTIYSQPVSLARTSAAPTPMDEGWKVNAADCSTNSCELFASADPVTSFWKTSQTCFQGEAGEIWEQYSGSFPSAGMMRNGKLYQRQVWERPTCARGSSLLPTVVANDWKTGSVAQVFKRRSEQLRDRVLLPTVTAAIASGGNAYQISRGKKILTLEGVTRGLLPTPIATDSKNRGTLDYRKSKGKTVHLQTLVGGNKLNPQFCEWMMGFPPGWTELED